VDLRTLLKILARRWIVVVPTILVAVLVAQQMLGKVKPEYEAKGSLLLLSPTVQDANAAAQTGGAVNPYPDLKPALKNAAAAFSIVMNDGAMKATIAKQGLSKDYDVTVDTDSPILLVTATSDRKRVAIETVKAVLQQTEDQITAREVVHKVAPANRMGTDILSSPTNASTVNSAKTRALIALIALGIAATLSVALLVESWAQSPARRDRRRGARRGDERDEDVVVPVGQRVPPAITPERATATGSRSRSRAARASTDDTTAAQAEDTAPATKPAARARAKPRGRTAAQ
jgi:capsular polysaccharide biosynthesis protein